MTETEQIGTWITDEDGNGEKVCPIHKMEIRIDKEEWDKINATEGGLANFLGQSVAFILQTRSRQRETLRQHIKDVMAVLMEGDREIRQAEAVGIPNIHTPITRFVRQFIKLLLLAQALRKDDCMEAIEDAKIIFGDMLEWAETNAPTEGDYLKMCNHLKLMFGGNESLMKDMEALDMWNRKSTKRIPRGVEGHMCIKLKESELGCPLSVLEKYDPIFLDEDEDMSKFEAFLV